MWSAIKRSITSCLSGCAYLLACNDGSRREREIDLEQGRPLKREWADWRKILIFGDAKFALTNTLITEQTDADLRFHESSYCQQLFDRYTSMVPMSAHVQVVSVDQTILVSVDVLPVSTDVFTDQVYVVPPIHWTRNQIRLYKEFAERYSCAPDTLGDRKVVVYDGTLATSPTVG